MIYKKDANFPYPILTNSSFDYEESEFYFDIELIENSEYYQFVIETTLTSSFIKTLLDLQKVELILIVQAKDNKFYPLKGLNDIIFIPKSRVSLNKRTTLQLQIRAKAQINFSANHELSLFYIQFKDKMNVEKNGTLGFSNIITFDSSNKKSYDLFEKKVDPNLLSEIKIELSTETIVIYYRNEEMQFAGLPHPINNLYVYMGLRTALQQFVLLFAEEGDECVYLNDINTPEEGLYLKLHQLMKQKGVEEISMDNLDAVIYQISDHIITKFTHTVRGLEGSAI